ncbi:hypothetical protein [Collimonas fungivorans]|uniref:hypothetical protein n=1 Tax=Collimonas fungivorans TaxID=158899 RepID=UPI0011D22812|nr:hypothetical protein [Collimonas fungivorans]
MKTIGALVILFSVLACSKEETPKPVVVAPDAGASASATTIESKDIQASRKAALEALGAASTPSKP